MNAIPDILRRAWPLALLVLLWLAPLPAQAAGILQDQGDATPPGDSPAVAPEGAEAFRHMAFDLGLGGGGFLSSGASTPALFLTSQLAYRLDDAWQFGLGYDAKLQPWENAQSLYHTVGAALRWRFYRGLYVGARLGAAFSYVEKDGYRQADFGVGWGVRFGYVWMPTEIVGLNAAAVVTMRYVGQVYTDLGAIAGLQLHF